MKRNAGRAYIIRYYDEKTENALFLGTRSSYGRRLNLSPNIRNAEIFLTSKDANDRIVSIKKNKEMTSGKGYWYIAKIFYKEEVYGYRNINRKIPIKLTKPDRHDFLNAI